MKKFRMEIVGKSFDINIEKGEGRRYFVTVNGKKYEAQVEDEFGKIMLLAVDGGLFNIQLGDGPSKGNMNVKVNERNRMIESKDFFSAKEIAAQKISISPPEAQVGVELRPAAITPNTDGILAPMPGKVISVKIDVGEKIRAGDVVLILEAMKMENEITSNKDGKVTEIRVKEGDSVDANDILIVIG